MEIFDKAKQKADDLGLPEKAEHVQEAATKAAHQAMEKVADLAEQNRDKVAGALDKATHAIDEKTHGKYHDTVSKAAGAVTKGVDKLAGQGSGRKPGAPGSEPDVPEPKSPETDEWKPPSDIPPADPV
ncbi:MAG: antitoxin [Micrococcales bacterium]|nr:antitoxin [Micrococcales bacterium]